MKHISRKTKIILSVLFPVLIVAWNIGFDLGAFGAVLYRNLMCAWIFALSTFSALVYFKVTKRTVISILSLIVVAIPVLWPGLDYIDQHVENIDIIYIMPVYYLIMAACLGYTLYIFLKLIKDDIFKPLNKKNLAFISGSVLLVTIIGIEVGSHHYLFLTCGHFKISGEFVPPNCYKHPHSTIPTFYRRSWETDILNVQ